MKYIFLILFITAVPKVYADDSNLLAEGQYWTDGIAGGWWGVSITRGGLVKTEESDYAFVLEEYEIKEILAVNFQESQFCNRISELGFYSLPKSIAPKEISYKEAAVVLQVNCNQKSKEVSLALNFKENETNPTEINNINIFKNAWRLLWQYSNSAPREFLNWL